jgi:hypothetical protein
MVIRIVSKGYLSAKVIANARILTFHPSQILLIAVTVGNTLKLPSSIECKICVILIDIHPSSGGF